MDTSANYWNQNNVKNSDTNPIDPTFSDAQHDSQYPSPADHVSAVVGAVVGANKRKGPLLQPEGDNSILAGSDEHEVSKQGRLLSNTKRAKQNRDAQRAFRQRKEVYIKDLEKKVDELKDAKLTIDNLKRENLELRDYILTLQSRLIEGPGGVIPPGVGTIAANVAANMPNVTNVSPKKTD